VLVYDVFKIRGKDWTGEKEVQTLEVLSVVVSWPGDSSLVFSNKDFFPSSVCYYTSFPYYCTLLTMYQSRK